MNRTLIAAALLFANGVAFGEEVGRLPTDWFVLPEDSQSFYNSALAKDTEEKDGVTYSRSEEKVAESVDKIFYYTLQGLDDSKMGLGSKQRPANAPADWAPWHLSEILMDLGVNAAGTAGLVTGIGEASVEVRWAQHEAYLAEHGIQKTTEKKEEAPAGDKPADLTLNEFTSYEEMNKMVDHVTDVAMATGKVGTDRGKVHEGLLKTAQDLQAVMVNINAYNDSYWDINKFGLDVEISGSGKVSAGWTLGLGVRLRFEWKRASYATPVPDPQDGNDKKREELRTLLASVAKDMDTVGQDLYAGSGFDLTVMRLGIGLYFAHNFGVVKGKLGVTGFAYFSKSAYKANRNYASRGRPRILLDEIPLIDDEPVAAHMTYAQQKGVKYDRIPGGDDGKDRVIYYMTREKFQKGLQTATKMGAFFAQRAHKKAPKKTGPDGDGSKRWLIDQLKPSFALSLEGALKIVTIGGKVSLELTFKAI